MDFYHRGRKLLDVGDFFEAEQAFKEGIQEGDIRCHYGILAVNAVQGKDCQEVIEWIKDVFEQLLYMAEERDSDSCFIVGRCFETGTGVESDMKKAIQYYEMAAEQNHADALFNLGCICMMFGGNRIVSAKKYFTKAAFAGSSDAKAALEQMKKDKLI